MSANVMEAPQRGGALRLTGKVASVTGGDSGPRHLVSDTASYGTGTPYAADGGMMQASVGL